jgi:hypothetical protein
MLAISREFYQLGIISSRNSQSFSPSLLITVSSSKPALSCFAHISLGIAFPMWPAKTEATINPSSATGKNRTFYKQFVVPSNYHFMWSLKIGERVT